MAAQGMTNKAIAAQLGVDANKVGRWRSRVAANLVERFFAILTQKQIRRGVFTSVPHLEKCLREYLQSYNDNPHALVWTKTVEEIVEKVRRGRTALSEMP